MKTQSVETKCLLQQHKIKNVKLTITGQKEHLIYIEADKIVFKDNLPNEEEQ